MRNISFIKLLGFTAILFLLGGCGSHVLRANKLLNPGSKYQPTMATPEDVDKYIAMISADNGKIVSDELGSYFHSVAGDTLVTAYLNKSEDNILRSLFSESVGIVTPVYIFSEESGRLKMLVDWTATQRRHKVFVDEIKLKVLPIEATRRYVAALENMSLEQSKKHTWNFKTSSVALERAGLKADYFIQSSHEEFYYENFPLYKKTGGPIPGVGDYDVARGEVENGGYHVGLVPVSLSSETRSGNMHMESRCGVVKIFPLKKQFDETGKKSALRIFKVTYVDAKSSDPAVLKKAAEEARLKELPNARKAFRKMLASQELALQETDRACISSLTAFRVTGAFSSSRLK